MHMRMKDYIFSAKFLCDEWRKFTSVSQSDSQSVSHSVNFPGGGANFDHVA